MGATGQFNMMGWLGLISPVMLVACLYFVLMYFQHLKNEEERLIKQTRLAAIICLAIALLVPAIYSFYMLNQMMR